MNWLEAIREAVRGAASDGSLLLMVVDSLNTKWIWRGDGGGRDHARAGKGGGVSPGVFMEKISGGDQ